MIHDPTAWLVTAMFLAVLIVVRRFQSTLQAESAEGFKYLGGGLSLLSLVVLARLFHTEGMFSEVPFLADKIFFDLVYWIGVMVGGVMAVTGAADWLPFARRQARLAADRPGTSDLLRRVQQLVGVENRIDSILTHVLQYMKDYSTFSYGAVLKLSIAHSQVRVTATAGEFPIDRDELHDAVASCFSRRRHEERAIDFERCLIECLPSPLGRPAAIVPIEVGRRICGCFVLWNKEGRVDVDDRLTLQLAADIVAHKIDRDQLLLAGREDSRRVEWFAALEGLVSAAGSVSGKVGILAREMARVIPIDAMAVTIVPADISRMIRYSVAAGGNVLVERAVERPEPTALAWPAYEADRAVVYGDLTPERQPDFREVITTGPVRSLLAVPVTVSPDYKVVLTLVSCDPEAYGPSSRRLLEVIRPLAAQAVQAELLRLIERRTVAPFEKLQTLGESVNRDDRIQALCGDMARLAADATGADIVRVALLDNSGLFLESQALISAPEIHVTVPAYGQMILALTPLHDLAVRSARTLSGYAHRADGLTLMESHQTFNDDVAWVMVVPIVHDGRVCGVISTAQLDDAPPTSGEIGRRVFLETLALTAAPFLALAAGTGDAANTTEVSRNGIGIEEFASVGPN